MASLVVVWFGSRYMQSHVNSVPQRKVGGLGRLVYLGQDDVGPRFSQANCDGLADSPRATGDQSGLPSEREQLHCHMGSGWTVKRLV